MYPLYPKRISSAKPGDVYEVPLNDNKKGYFQYLMLDPADLNSEVIRVFKRRYNIDQEVSLERVVTDSVDFYAHTTIPAGIRQGIYSRVGRVDLDKDLEPPSFREDRSVENHYPGRVSNEWYIWKVGEEAMRIGSLAPEYKTLNRGGVFPPSDVVYRMNTGESEFVEAG